MSLFNFKVILLPVLVFNECSPDGAVFPNPSQMDALVVTDLISADGEWKMSGKNTSSVFLPGCTADPNPTRVCPKGSGYIFDTNYPQVIADVHTPTNCGIDPFYSGGCVWVDFRGTPCAPDPDYQYISFTQQATSLYHWECP